MYFRSRKLMFLLGLVVSFFFMAASAHAGAEGKDYEPRTVYGPQEHIIYAPDEITWEVGPGSLPEGVEHAILEGDLGEAGMFVMRLRFPDGYVIPPHTHPNFERVTVLSGTFFLGHGEELDRAKARRLEAGGFTTMLPKTVHFAIAEGETVVQLTSIGPWEINYINPEDDPRR